MMPKPNSLFEQETFRSPQRTTLQGGLKHKLACGERQCVAGLWRRGGLGPPCSASLFSAPVRRGCVGRPPVGSMASRRCCVTPACREEYLEAFRKIDNSYPEAWHMAVQAKDRCRAEHFPRVRRQRSLAHWEGRGPTFDPLAPRIDVRGAAAREKADSGETVRDPALAFVARGGAVKWKAISSVDDIAGDQPHCQPVLSKGQRKRAKKKVAKSPRSELPGLPQSGRGPGQGAEPPKRTRLGGSSRRGRPPHLKQ